MFSSWPHGFPLVSPVFRVHSFLTPSDPWVLDRIIKFSLVRKQQTTCWRFLLANIVLEFTIVRNLSTAKKWMMKEHLCSLRKTCWTGLVHNAGHLNKCICQCTATGGCIYRYSCATPGDGRMEWGHWKQGLHKEVMLCYCYQKWYISAALLVSRWIKKPTKRNMWSKLSGWHCHSSAFSSHRHHSLSGQVLYHSL